MSLYLDRWIRCDDDALVVRAYYFPWGTKRIPYTKIRAVTVVPLGLLSGKARIWGSANPTLWASLDLHRASKQRALVLDLGHTVRPFLTPADMDAAVQVIQQKTGLQAGSRKRGQPV
jgi:hypothetical protein